MRALDLFCGAGGAGMGLHEAGFEVTGVDLRPQPHYPFAFVQADATAIDLSGYDFIWASPPCQHYSNATAMKGVDRSRHPDLVAVMRDRLIASSTPYVIENVPGAPLIDPIMLCGTMFEGLRVYRHRLFESSLPLSAPVHARHIRRTFTNPPFRRGAPLGARLVAERAACGPEEWVSVAGHSFIAEQGRAAMGIPWMTRDELAQAIPPAYSRCLGAQAHTLIRERARRRAVIDKTAHGAPVWAPPYR